MTRNDWIFQVTAKDGKVYRIWANGKIEGFGQEPVVVNRIPLTISDARRNAKEAGIQAGQMGSANPPDFPRN
jgi:hypothetical protein